MHSKARHDEIIMRQAPFKPDPLATLPAELKALRQSKGISAVKLAELTGLSRQTVAAAEGLQDARLSSVVQMFEALGYVLMPVPKELVAEAASFIANGGRSISLPAGVAAPLGVGQAAFAASTAKEPRE
jgi:DNA-binding XRE family transcriptional regulator